MLCSIRLPPLHLESQRSPSECKMMTSIFLSLLCALSEFSCTTCYLICGKCKVGLWCPLTRDHSLAMLLPHKRTHLTLHRRFLKEPPHKINNTSNSLSLRFSVPLSPQVRLHLVLLHLRNRHRGWIYQNH